MRRQRLLTKFLILLGLLLILESSLLLICKICMHGLILIDLGYKLWRPTVSSSLCHLPLHLLLGLLLIEKPIPYFGTFVILTKTNMLLMVMRVSILRTIHILVKHSCTTRRMLALPSASRYHFHVLYAYRLSLSSMRLYINRLILYELLLSLWVVLLLLEKANSCFTVLLAVRFSHTLCSISSLVHLLSLSLG